MSTIIDYTKMRRNSVVANHYICVCPKCGKKGLRFTYSVADGKQVSMYAHRGEKTLAGVEITKSCKIVTEVTAVTS